MADLYLQSLMHGDLLDRKKSQLIDKLIIFEEKWEKEINLYIAESLKNEPFDSQLDPLHNLQTKKAKLKADIEETLQFSDLSKHIQLALEFLNSSGESSLITNFSKLQEHESGILDESKDFQDILEINDDTLSSLVKIGMESFSQGLFAESMAIFILLTTLSPSKAGYWYRAGIAADKQEKYDLAIKFYSAAASLEPDLIGPKAFLVDCYLESQKLNEAEAAYALALQSKSKNPNNSWVDFLSNLEKKIQVALNKGKL